MTVFYRPNIYEQVCKTDFKYYKKIKHIYFVLYFCKIINFFITLFISLVYLVFIFQEKKEIYRTKKCIYS